MSASITPNLLQALLSPNGDVRSQAERAFQSVSLLDRIQGLLQHLLLSSSNDPAVRLLTAVLLRRDIVKLSSAQHLMELVSPLLQAFQQQDQQQQVGHCLAEVCSSLTLVQPDAVAGALTSILTALQASIQQGHVPSLQLLAALAEKAPMAFTQLAVDSLPSFDSSAWTSNPAALEAWAQVLVNAAIATTVTSVQIGGTATTNLDDWVVEPDSRAAKLGPCLMPHFQWLQSNAAALSDYSVKILQHLAHAAVSCPSLLAGNAQVLSTCIQTCLHVSTTAKDASLAALHVLSSLVSVGDVKRRYLPADLATAMATTAIPLCIQIMAEHAGDSEDDQQWAETPATLVQDGMDDDEEEDDYLFAVMLLESFLQDLGGACLDVVLPLTESLLQDASRARVGLAVLECAVASTPLALTRHLPVVVQAASTLALANPRTRYHAIRLLGALCVTHASILRASYSQPILEAFAAALGSTTSKVSVVASLGLVSFCRGGDDLEQVAECLVPFMDGLLNVLIQGPLALTGTDGGSIAVRVRAIGVPACLAQASGEAFAPFYSRIMPGLLATCQLLSVDLAGAAMEAATIVGQAVGKELFQSDAQQLLGWILPALQQPESPILEPLLLACARIASVLEEDFAPYADSVVPLLLLRVQKPPDVSIVEGDEAGLQADEGDQGIESMTVAVPGRGYTKVTINTTMIQEKAQAARALYEHAKAMGAAYGPYVERSLEAFLPLVNFPYSADVRSTSAQTLGAIFDAACQTGEDIGMAIPRQYLPLLAKTISTQIAQEETTDMEALYALADSLSEVYYIAYRYRKTHSDILANFGLVDAQASVEACMKTMVACLQRRAQITQVLGGANLTGEDEKQDYLDQLQAEQQLLTPLVDSVGYTLKFFRQDFLPLFEKYVAPILGPKLESQSDVRASLSAVCLYDDVVEHCGADAAAKYAPQLMQGVVKAFDQNSNEKDLVQAAVYGIAQMARYAPSGVFSSHLQTIIHRLLALTSRPKNEAGDDLYLVEIAASALASVTLLGPYPDVKFVPRQTLVDSLLSQLPILQDDDEAKLCHAGLCHLVENGTIALDQEAVRVARIIGDVLVEVQEGEDVATPDTVERMSSILFQMQQGLAPSTLQQAFGALEPEAQQVVGSVLQDLGLSRAHVVTP